jgi:hypothetical protein
MAKTRSKQRPYKMKGCSKRSRKRNYLGGTYLGYTGEKSAPVNNPFLAYTSGGGMSRAYPSPGPDPGGFNFLNPQQNQNGGGYGRMMGGQRGGDCGCGSPLIGGGQSGGGCGCGSPLMGGGSMWHGKDCMCDTCRGKTMKGGTMSYPNGLIGKPWGGAIQQWPGVDGVDGGRNHLGYNTYSPVDISRQMKFVSASGGGKKKKTRKRKAQKGGFIGNDLINLSKFGAGSFYNAVKGYPQPVSPLAWKDQLTNY